MVLGVEWRWEFRERMEERESGSNSSMRTRRYREKVVMWYKYSAQYFNEFQNLFLGFSQMKMR
jgi:hypothetical protein